ncbi:hypothetical protein LCGC14_1859850 [marine sediment metagenome]|uniref:Uncharacterized protein n=1 Tax=marine sediment metagenome TaxID=412755 RepID=A0A0F9G884_9ZZZZ
MATGFGVEYYQGSGAFSLNVPIVTSVTKTAPIVRIVTVLQLFLMLLLFGGDNA